jgi:hypothetical protein
MDSLKGLEEELESARASIEGCKAETDLERFETMLDGLAGSARSLGALRLAGLEDHVGDMPGPRHIANSRERSGTAKRTPDTAECGGSNET